MTTHTDTCHVVRSSYEDVDALVRFISRYFVDSMLSVPRALPDTTTEAKLSAIFL
jgi:hypothetical protein